MARPRQVGCLQGGGGLRKLKGCAFFAGLDLANIRDVAAAVFLFPMEDGRFFVTQRFWVPKENMEERVRKDRVPYDAWVRDGW